MTRIITGGVGILVMIPVCIYSHTFIWPLLLAFFSFIAVDEILVSTGFSKIEKTHSTVARIFSLLPMCTYLLSIRNSYIDEYRSLFLFSALFFFIQLVVALFKGNRLHSDKLYGMIAMVLYVVVSLTAISHIRFINYGNEEGKYIYLLVFFGGWVSDTFAYFSGRLFGKHKLCPAISPKKTVEGSIGGVLANMIAFAGYAFILRQFFDVSANIIFFAILGALFSAVGQFGDLIASSIKRHYGVKDFGKFFPGHGGVLDRFDSTLAIATVMLILDAAFGAKFLIG